MKSHKQMTIAVLGDGGWGTTLALHLNRLNHRVQWWGAFSDNVNLVNKRRVNARYLPGIRIPKNLPLSSQLSEVLEGASLVVLAIPSQYVRTVAKSLAGYSFRSKTILNVAKGLECSTLKRMSQIIKEELGPVHYAALSGPNIAIEIARGHPASSVVASINKPLALTIQKTFMDERLRIYTSTDLIGVELGGALKNPIAIAAGIGDGLGFASNARAALVTRGILEVSRLGEASGGRPETFWGLSGLGDLVTTCSAGRNRWLGEQIGRGRSLSAILSSTPMVIEGVETARAALALGARMRIELPIIEQVNAILFKGRSPKRALKLLMQRSQKSECVQRATRSHRR